MKLGTKSLLYGAHAFWLHPFMVAYAWKLTYGKFPLDPRLWFCFFFHDIGYWGCPNMDGKEGKLHPLRGARWIYRLFGYEWARMSLLHSQSYVKKLNNDYGTKFKPSSLCWPDKLATLLVPKSIYLFMVRATGELADYKSNMGPGLTDDEWYNRMCASVSRRLRAGLSTEEVARIEKYLTS